MIFILNSNQPSLLISAQNYNFLYAIAERFGMADPNLKDLDQTGPLTELLA